MLYRKNKMKLGIKRIFFFFNLIVLGVILPTSHTQASDVTVTIDGQILYQTMDGFGTTIRVFDDPHVFDNFNGATGRALTTMTEAQENEILDLLYVDLGLTRVRPATDIGPVNNNLVPPRTDSIEPINDNNDPNNTDLAAFNFSWKRNDAFVDLINRLVPRGVTNFFLSPIELEVWMTESNPEEYVEWAMAIINRWRTLGVEMPFYSIMNEPGYKRGGYWSGEYIRDVIKLLGPRLAAENFTTQIIVPDDLSADQALSRLQIIMADVDARQYVGAFGYHLYAGSDPSKQSINNMAAQYNVPVWMTEWSTPTWLTPTEGALRWANTMHNHINQFGVSALDYMWGFFGEWEPISTHLVSLLYTGATYTGYRLNRNYFIMGQYSRFVKPGFVRVDVSSSSAFVRCTAYMGDTEYVQVCINSGNTNYTVAVNLTGITGINELQAVRSRFDGTENWVNLPAVTVSNNSFNVTLPGGSITTYSVSGAKNPTPDLIFLDGFDTH